MAKQCNECGCTEILIGKLGNYTQIKKPGFAFKSSSMTAEVCAKCGTVIQLRVDNPDKLK